MAWKIAFLLMLNSFPALAITQRPATLLELNGMVKILGCSGALVTLGQKISDPGIILTAGHCASYPTFYKNGEAKAGTDLSGLESATTFPSANPQVQSLKLPLARLYYSTMTNVDAALLKVKTSQEALAGEKLNFLRIADHLPKPGDILRITSAFWQETEECEVEKILEDNQAEEDVVGAPTDDFSFQNSILFKAPCYARGGWSGSPVFNGATGLVYGVLSRIYKDAVTQGPQLAHFAEFIPKQWNPFNPKTPDEVRVVASNLTDLRDCLTADGALDLRAKHCELPTPMKDSPKNSLWPNTATKR